MTACRARQWSAHAMQLRRENLACRDRRGGAAARARILLPVSPAEAGSMPSPIAWHAPPRDGCAFRRLLANLRASRRFAFNRRCATVYLRSINNFLRGRASCASLPWHSFLQPSSRWLPASIRLETAPSAAPWPVRSLQMSLTTTWRLARSSAGLPVRPAARCRVRSTADLLTPLRAAVVHLGPSAPLARMVPFAFEGGLRCSTRS